MELPQALADIAEIRDQVAQADVYRGLPVGAGRALRPDGPCSRVAAAARPGGDPLGFVIYWVAVAVCAGFVGVSEIALQLRRPRRGSARRRTRRVVGQLLPSLLAGAIITAASCA